MLSCGTGAWRVRTSMNRLSKSLGVTCTVDVGLMSIEFNCFDGKDCVSQSLSIANTGVNTSKLYRMEQFVDSFPKEEVHLTGEEIHKRLDEIERIHAIYSPVNLGLAAALACCAFTFLKYSCIHFLLLSALQYTVKSCGDSFPRLCTP